jgi:hypothetical protein
LKVKLDELIKEVNSFGAGAKTQAEMSMIELLKVKSRVSFAGISFIFLLTNGAFTGQQSRSIAAKKLIRSHGVKKSREEDQLQRRVKVRAVSNFTFIHCL